MELNSSWRTQCYCDQNTLVSQSWINWITHHLYAQVKYWCLVLFLYFVRGLVWDGEYIKYTGLWHWILWFIKDVQSVVRSYVILLCSGLFSQLWHYCFTQSSSQSSSEGQPYRLKIRVPYQTCIYICCLTVIPSSCSNYYSCKEGSEPK